MSSIASSSFTLDTLATARGLKVEILTRLGWHNGPDGVAIPWPTRHGDPAIHVRRRLDKDGQGPRWRWRCYDRATILPYGADRLDQMRQKAPEALVIVESELDAVALWIAGIPALATGGADGWQGSWWALLHGFQRAIVWIEDAGTLPLLRALIRSRPDGAPALAVCQNLRGPKDPGRIRASVNGDTAGILRQIVAGARPVQRVEGPLLQSVVATLKARPSGQGYMARCPFHHDTHPSLSIFQREGNWYVKCHGACGVSGSLELCAAALGLVADGEGTGKFVTSHIERHCDETNKTVSKLSFAPLAQLVTAQPEAIGWLWEGFLAQGAITLLAGKPKSGKTTLTCALLSALARGAEFLGHSTRQARAVMLTEERAPTLAQKARRWGIGDRVDVLLRHQALGVPWPEVIRHAVEHAKASGAELLVVDTFAEWAELAGDTENSAGAVLIAMQPLQWAAAQGLAVLLVAHQRKSDGEHGEAVRGSSAITGAVDVLVEIERPAKGIALPSGARVLRGLGRFDCIPPEIAIELTDSGYVARGTLPEAEGAAQRQAILDVLATAGEATADQVAEAVGIPKATAHKRLAELLEAGNVIRSGVGRRGDPYRWRSVFVSSRSNPICDETKDETKNERWAIEHEHDPLPPEALEFAFGANAQSTGNPGP